MTNKVHIVEMYNGVVHWRNFEKVILLKNKTKEQVKAFLKANEKPGKTLTVRLGEDSSTWFTI